MSGTTIRIIGCALLALFLGIASGTGEEAASVPWAIAHTLTIGAALALFFFILPGRMSQPAQIFVAMLVGVLTGWLFYTLGNAAFVDEYIGIFGRLFVLMLTLVIIPLIFVSIVCGVSGIGDISKLGRLGGKTVAYYLGTTSLAVLVGMTVINLLRPGSGLDPDQVLDEGALGAGAGEGYRSLGVRIQEDFLPTIIQNPIMADQSPLVVIFFAILLGAALAAVGAQAQSARTVFEGLDKALIQIIMWVMMLAPLGVFALMARAIATLGIEYIMSLAFYFVSVLIALGLHWLLLILLVVPLLARVDTKRFLTSMAPAFQLAFSTSSSSATLPVTLKCSTERLKANENVSNFVLPIGATINMDGTALYTSMAAIFIAEVYGISLTPLQQLPIFLTAIVVSVGTAGIPGASIGLLSIILASAGIPIEGIGIVVGVDRFLDMTRTLVNVTGDSAGAAVISRSEGLMDDAEPAAAEA